MDPHLSLFLIDSFFHVTQRVYLQFYVKIAFRRWRYNLLFGPKLTQERHILSI